MCDFIIKIFTTKNNKKTNIKKLRPLNINNINNDFLVDKNRELINKNINLTKINIDLIEKNKRIKNNRTIILNFNKYISTMILLLTDNISLGLNNQLDNEFKFIIYSFQFIEKIQG